MLPIDKPSGTIDQQSLEDRILDGQGHTYGGLCTEYSADETIAMQIDRTLQKLRRHGKIEFKRKGRVVTWTALPGNAG